MRLGFAIPAFTLNIGMSTDVSDIRLAAAAKYWAAAFEGLGGRAAGLLVSVLCLSLIAATGCSGKSAKAKSPPPPAVVPDVIVARPVQKTVPIYSEYIGQTEAINTVEIRSQVTGFLAAIKFREGSTVQKDQLLFVIDPRQYQAALDQAEAKLNQARAVLNNDQKNLARDEILYREKVLPRATLDTQRAQTKADKANVGAAQASVDAAKLNVGFTKIYAPITGLIGVAQVKVGGLVQQASTLLDTIYSINPIYVNFSVTEQTYLRYAEEVATTDRKKPPPPVQLLLPGNYVYHHAGSIDMATPAVSTSTGTLGIRAVFPNPKGILRAGLFVRVRLVTREVPNAILVPVQAISTVQGQQQVMIVGEDNKVELRTIQAGAQIGNMRVITKGVNPTDRVIVEGLQKVRPGMTVNAKTRPSSGQSLQQIPSSAPAAARK
ncbi:MAG: efflux RND transporter periplasmic adaptor subunit [Candidatus Binataceae bacterium]